MKCFTIAVVLALLVPAARADVVTLKNGDKINGKVGTIAAGKMKFTSPVLGDITIDMANVDTFTTDEPATIQRHAAPIVSDKITAGNADKIETAGGQSYNLHDLKAVNPPAEKWTGAIIANGALARGNTDTLDIGVGVNAVLRRDNENYDDRFTLGGAYNFGTTGKGDNTATTTDNWMALAKYDKFWSEKFYGYAQMKVEHDRIAVLRYRLSPGVGIGYQWIESPNMNFNTEAGVSYVYEKYDTGDNDDFVALRLAYHFDKKLAENVKFFHNVEWLPAFDDPSDYNLNADAGIRTDLTKTMFTEVKVEYQRDSTPAPGALKNDLRYIVGIGWTF